MNKISKTIIGGLTLFTFSSAFMMLPQTTQAKSRAAKQLSVKKVKKSTYKVNGGSIYTSTKLTKKSHNGRNYLKTTFYVTKSAVVKKTNGKKAVYYYIMNKSGKVKGWIWRGNTTKYTPKSYARQSADIKAVVAAVRKMDPSDRASVLSVLSKVTPASAYKSSDKLPYGTKGLSSVFLEMDYAVTGSDNGNEKNIAAALAVYDIFKGRFNSTINAQLKGFHDLLVEQQESDDSNTGDRVDAICDFSSALSNAVLTLH